MSKLNNFTGHLINYIRDYRAISPENAATFREEIETFMTEVENRLLRLKREQVELHQDSLLELLETSGTYNTMQFVFASAINECQNGPQSPIYQQLVSFLGPNDSLMTFNWDTLLDRSVASSALWHPDTGYCIKLDKMTFPRICGHEEKAITLTSGGPHHVRTKKTI